MKSLGLATPAIDVIIQLFKDNLGSSTIKQYFFGDPIAIPKSMLPCIIVDEEDTSYELGPTSFDEITHNLLIQIVFDKSMDYGKPSNEVGVLRELQELVQGRDETTRDFKTNTILGILRKNVTINNLVLQTIPSVQFGVVPRPQDTTTQEAHIRLQVQELQHVANRL